MNIHFLTAEPSQSTKIHGLVKRVFDTHVAPAYSAQGVEEFYRYIVPVAIEKRLEENHFILLAQFEGNLVGLIEVRNADHVSMLFVDTGMQRKGIGRQLLNLALTRCREENSELTHVTVHASPNAYEAYRAFGFVPTDDEKEMNGIRFTTMELSVPSLIDL